MALVCCRSSSGEQRFEDETVGFRLTYPGGWRSSRERNAAVFRPAHRNKRTSLAVSVAKKNDGAHARDWQAVREGLLTQYRALPGFKLERDATGTHAGQTSWSLQVRFEHGGVPYRRRQLVLELPGHFVFLDCSSASATFPDETCRRFFDSMEVM